MDWRYLARSLGVGLAVALAGVACTSQKSDAWPAITATRTWDGSGLAVAWRNTELHPVGQPFAFDAVVVGIVSTDDDELFIVGLDPASGGKLWQRPITPSSIAPGVRITVEKVDGNKVAYFRPTGENGRQAELVVADARTGKDLAKSSNGVFSSSPTTCANGKDVCVLSRVGDVSVREFRLEIATGRYRVSSERLPRGTRLLDDAGLLDLGGRPDTLGLLRNGIVQWRTPISSAFPPGFSTDNGWAWQLFPDHRVIVGSVDGEPSIVDANKAWDLARTTATAGISEATGEVLWRDRGSALHCNMRGIKRPVRCRESGIAISSPDGPVSYKGLQVTVEGFDVTTGMTTWSVPLGAAMALTFSRVREIAGATQVVVDGPAGPVVLDHATGKTHAPVPGATFWCMTSSSYTLSLPYWTPDGPWYKRSGGELAAICDAHRGPASALPSVAATMAAGAQVGGYAVIATHHGYVGLKVL